MATIQGDAPEQLELISGFYRCHACGRNVPETRQIRRWRLCPECWKRIAPAEENREEVRRFWEWHFEMEERYPLSGKWYRFRPVDTLPDGLSFNHFDLQAASVHGSPGRFKALNQPYEMYTADSFYPLCECGEERPEYEHGRVVSLFGKMRAPKCPTCTAKQNVESVFGMREGLHPGWDDEEWLDLLFRSHPEAFEVGVLPDYWYELKEKVNDI